MISNRAVPLAEGRIEAGNLRQIGKKRENGVDGREIVRLVQGRKRHIALEAGEHLRIYGNRLFVLRAAHEPVTDSAWQRALLFTQPRTGCVQRLRHIGDGGGIISAIDERTISAIDETRSITAARS